MLIFDDFNRADMGFATDGEGLFSFLNRSNRPEFVAARNIIEEWFLRYPVQEQAELAARFRDSNSRVSFNSAFFELFLHEFFLKQGCGIEIHPRSSGSAKRPDFLVTTPAGSSLFLEAVLVTGVNDSERSSQARMNDLYNALNQVDCPDYFIRVDYKDFEPVTSIRVTKVRKDVQLWIDGLDYENVMAVPMSGSFDDLPNLLVEHDGQTIRLVAVPKKREARGLPDVPVVGGSSGGAFWVRTYLDIRSAVKKKRASQYDLSGRPYVVAIQCQDVFTRQSDIERALYGLWSGNKFDELGHTVIADAEEGIWSGRNGPRNTSISGVLIVRNLHPGNTRDVQICLYRNPWAKNAVSGHAVSVTEATLVNAGVEYLPRDHRP